MGKQDLGKKRRCASCGMKFYDFNKSKIECPGCQTEFNPDNLLKSRRGRTAKASSAATATTDALDDEKDLIEDDSDVADPDADTDDLDDGSLADIPAADSGDDEDDVTLLDDGGDDDFIDHVEDDDGDEE